MEVSRTSRSSGCSGTVSPIAQYLASWPVPATWDRWATCRPALGRSCSPVSSGVHGYRRRAHGDAPGRHPDAPARLPNNGGGSCGYSGGETERGCTVAPSPGAAVALRNPSVYPRQVTKACIPGALRRRLCLHQNLESLGPAFSAVFAFISTWSRRQPTRRRRRPAATSPDRRRRSAASVWTVACLTGGSRRSRQGLRAVAQAHVGDVLEAVRERIGERATVVVVAVGKRPLEPRRSAAPRGGRWRIAGAASAMLRPAPHQEFVRGTSVPFG